MLPIQKRYFKPSKDARVLAILESLSLENELSQSELGRRLRLSGAMVNQYLRELQDEHLIEYEAINGKSYRYVLTAKGERKRQVLFSGCSTEAIQIYAALKDQIAAKLKLLQGKKVEKCVLFGASDTCEVVLGAISHTSLEVVALLDNDPIKQGKRLHGYIISPPQVLETIACQAVLITSYARQDEIHAQIEPLCLQKGMEIMRL